MTKYIEMHCMIPDVLAAKFRIKEEPGKCPYFFLTRFGKGFSERNLLRLLRAGRDLWKVEWSESQTTFENTRFQSSAQIHMDVCNTDDDSRLRLWEDLNNAIGHLPYERLENHAYSDNIGDRTVSKSLLSHYFSTMDEDGISDKGSKQYECSSDKLEQKHLNYDDAFDDEPIDYDNEDLYEDEEAGEEACERGGSYGDEGGDSRGDSDSDEDVEGCEDIGASCEGALEFAVCTVLKYQYRQGKRRKKLLRLQQAHGEELQEQRRVLEEVCGGIREHVQSLSRLGSCCTKRVRNGEDSNGGEGPSNRRKSRVGVGNTAVVDLTTVGPNATSTGARNRPMHSTKDNIVRLMEGDRKLSKN